MASKSERGVERPFSTVRTGVVMVSGYMALRRPLDSFPWFRHILNRMDELCEFSRGSALSTHSPNRLGWSFS